MHFTIALPEGFRAAEVLHYHGRDAGGPAERVNGLTFQKALSRADTRFVLTMQFQPGLVVCDAEGGQEAWAREAAFRMLGLASETVAFEERITGDEEIGRLVGHRRGLRVPLGADAFESVCWAIIGQQINLAFATALRRSLIDLAGVAAGKSGMRAHPDAFRVAELRTVDLTQRRFSRSKAEYLIGAARAVVEGELPLNQLAEGPANEAESRLMVLRGFGPWTTRYVMMRGLGFGDCAPVGDSALSASLKRFYGLAERPNAARTEQLMARFSPHRSLATCHFWAGLQENL